MKTFREAALDGLAFQFFKIFARFEYALKAAGFHAGKEGKARKAEANWDSFAKSLNSLFEEEHEGELGEAVRYMLDEPPKVQMVNAAGQLEWADKRETGPTARQLFLYIRRVRNNLFHGGKFNGHWFARERSEPLIRHSLTILEA
jgi:hypothetical protein